MIEHSHSHSHSHKTRCKHVKHGYFINIKHITGGEKCGSKKDSGGIKFLLQKCC